MSLFKSQGKHASKAKKAGSAQPEASSVVTDEESLAAEEASAASRESDKSDSDATERIEAVDSGATQRIEALGDDATQRIEISGDDATQRIEISDGDATEPIESKAASEDAENAGEDEAADGGRGSNSEADEDSDGESNGAVEEKTAGTGEAPFEADAVSGDAAAGFVSAGFAEIPSKKRRSGLKVFGITLGIIVAAALIAYVAGAVVFMGRFLPNTKVGEQNISLKTDEEVVSMLEDVVTDYRLDIVGGGFSYRATGEELGVSIDAEGIVDAMHEDLDAWRWPLLIMKPLHDETDQLGVSAKQSSYKDDITAAVEEFNETAKDPVNATISYDKKNDKFVVQPEEAGTKFDSDAVLEAVADAIDALESKVSLGEEELIQPTVLATDEKLIEAAELATGMVSADLTLLMDGTDAGTINGEMLSGFISVNDDYEVVFSEDEMNGWIDSLVAGLDTIGTERTYTRADGKDIAVSGGVYGWEVDTEALRAEVIEGIKAGATTEIEVPCIETADVFNGANQRDWGERYIDVDLSEQHVRFYGDDGGIIWEADCISGEPDGTHDTGEGVWYVNAKESPSKLIGYENGKKIYETTVTYWMPFEGNGIGFHDATWQPSFGGSMYANGYGSHGCVNLSYEDAESLYDIIEGGDVVVVHY